MWISAIATLVFGAVSFWAGLAVGRSLLQRGVTADNLFKGQNAVSLLFLGLYILLVVLALNIPQMQFFPQSWRANGLQVSWTFLRVSFLGFCGVAWAITRETAPRQVGAIALLSILGVGAFTAAERYVLAPIYKKLTNNLQSNGVFKQTSMTSCAPASLATVLRLWQIEAATEVSVAEAAETSRLGTTMPQLIQATRQFGLEAVQLSSTWEQMQRINRPGVVSVWLLDEGRKLPHAMSVLGMNSEKIVLGDPASGKMLLYTREEFAEIYRNEYLPIYRRQEVTLLKDQEAADYLRKLGYQASNLKENVRQFQSAIGVQPTGNLTPETTLLLLGAFLKDMPTLKDLPL
jgi:predicted double-glycine peptidase